MPTLDEIKFLREQFAGIKDSQEYQLPSEYMESVRYLTTELSPKPGFYDYEYTPYLREIVDNLSPESPVRKVAFMKPSQIGATVGILEAIIGYYIGCAPTSIFFITADKGLAEKAVEIKIDQMLESCGLTDRIFAQNKTIGSRATGNTKELKQFPGGFLLPVGARSPGKLRQMACRVILMDELDGFPDEIGKEGSPVSLAENRSNAFAAKRKILYQSTPVILQTSFIYPLYMMGDQRNFFIKCPRCGELIVMQWHIKGKDGKDAGIQYKHKDGILIPESVHYRCQDCGKPIDEEKKKIFLPGGKWIPTAKTQELGLVSYWLDVCYSPLGMYSWINATYDWFKAWDVTTNRIKDLKEYRAFRNTKQGKPFEEKGEALLIEKVLIHRRPIYSRNQIKNRIFQEETGSPVYKLTCAVDVQKTPGKGELLVDIKAWCKNAISYTLDFRHLSAEKDVTDFHDKCWRDLEKLIETEIWTADDKKQYQIGLTVIDAAWGESTDTVYQFCRQYSDNVFPTFGTDKLKDGLTLIPVSKSTLEKAGCMCYRINTVKMKDRVSRMINASWYSGEMQPMFYMNFPDDLREDYFKQFTAEHKIPKYHSKTNKFLGFEWIQTQGRENHAFDLAGYHFAAIELMAENICTRGLGLDALSWPAFWEYLGK